MSTDADNNPKPSTPRPDTERTAVTMPTDEQEIVDLSQRKWDWMSQRRIEPLSGLIHDDAVFVHMGATMTKTQELDVISSGQIQYKRADIEETSVPYLSGSTAIMLTKLKLLAVVDGHEVTNPFVVTEVYVRESDSWRLASLSFTRVLTA